MIDRSKLAKKIRSGEPVIGVWMQVPHPMVAETLSQTGVDFLLVDGEHGPIPPDALGSLLPSMDLHGMPALYRVRWNTSELIKGALDSGVSGIMVPMVNSVAEASAAVASAKYPPMGTRGSGAWRASNYFLNEAEYTASANTDTAVVLQIETKEALDAVDEIAATPGIDAIFLGPADLALSLGITPGQPHPAMQAAYLKVIEAAHKNGIAAGIDVTSSAADARKYRDLGFSLFTHGLDYWFILEGGKSAMEKLHEALMA